VLRWSFCVSDLSLTGFVAEVVGARDELGARERSGADMRTAKASASSVYNHEAPVAESLVAEIGACELVAPMVDDIG